MDNSLGGRRNRAAAKGVGRTKGVGTESFASWRRGQPDVGCPGLSPSTAARRSRAVNGRGETRRRARRIPRSTTFVPPEHRCFQTCVYRVVDRFEVGHGRPNHSPGMCTDRAEGAEWRRFQPLGKRTGDGRDGTNSEGARHAPERLRSAVLTARSASSGRASKTPRERLVRRRDRRAGARRAVRATGCPGARS